MAKEKDNTYLIAGGLIIVGYVFVPPVRDFVDGVLQGIRDVINR